MTTLQAPPEPRTAPAPIVLVRRARYEPEPGADHPTPSAGTLQPTSPDADVTHAQLVDAHRHIVPVLRLALEVLDGRRSADHLGGHTSPEVLRYWRAARGQRRARTPARLTGLRVCLPTPGTAEVAAVCAIDGRVRALATRFERRAGRWRCTAVRLG